MKAFIPECMFENFWLLRGAFAVSYAGWPVPAQTDRNTLDKFDFTRHEAILYVGDTQ